MSRAWLLPEQFADVLPSQARRVEELRRTLIDRARGYGYELVIPPLVEHLDSLLSGTGQSLGLKTFKLVDQLSGRTLGLRADTTPQVARIDAHLLNRDGVARLAYCGSVLHARADGALASRDLLQFRASSDACASRKAMRRLRRVRPLRTCPGYGPSAASVPSSGDGRALRDPTSFPCAHGIRAS